MAFDFPAYQTVAVRLVPREDFQQAIALNSTNFHGARVVGPFIAGLLMAWVGPGAVFFLDGLIYFGLIFVLKSIQLREVQRDEKRKPSVSSPFRRLTLLIQHSPHALYVHAIVFNNQLYVTPFHRCVQDLY